MKQLKNGNLRKGIWDVILLLIGFVKELKDFILSIDLSPYADRPRED